MKPKILILLCSTLLSACSLSTEEAIEKSKASCLDTLHPVKNRDDLISQMFETALEDDCLYHFTPAELEKIWGIPVFDLVPPVAGTDLHKPLNKDIQSPIGLYVEKVDRPKVKEFYVQMTMNELNKSFSIFPEGRFPSSLPKPKSFALSEAALTHPPAYIPPYKSHSQARIKPERTYYWMNGERVMAVTSRVGEVAYLYFTNDRNGTDLSDANLAVADHAE